MKKSSRTHLLQRRRWMFDKEQAEKNNKENVVDEKKDTE